MFLRIASVVVSLALISHAYVGDGFWTIVSDGANPPHSSNFAAFHGVNGFLAYKISDNGAEAFGNTYVNEGGRLCARFADSTGRAVFDCAGFRVLGNGGSRFALVPPGSRLSNRFVEFHHKRAAVIYTEKSNEGFFGWVDLDRSVAWGVDRENRIVQMIGKEAISKSCQFIELI